MYDFHYNFIKNNVDVELLFTDTDSLTYEINYQKDLNFFDETYEKVIGKMKCKFGGFIVNEIVVLK